jgi:phage RecT family recombinase
MAENAVATRPKYELMALEARTAFLQVADEKTWNKEIIFALQAIRSNKLLQNCDAQSIKNAVVNISLTAATLNPVLKQAFLIPRKVSGVMTCCLDFSARGLCQIAIQDGMVKAMEAYAVFEKDDFYYELGLNPVLRHVPYMGTESKGKVIAAYSVAILKDGTKTFIVIDREKIERARKTSQAPNSPMWSEHYDEAAKKTVVKLHTKYLPQGERMQTAIDVLNQHEGLPEKGMKAASVMERFAEHQEETIIDQDQAGGTGDKQQEESKGEKISSAQAKAIKGTLKTAQVEESEFCTKYGIGAIEDLTSDKHKAALEWILEEAKNRK